MHFQHYTHPPQPLPHTQNLEDPNPPGLAFAQDNSPWYSSSESTYSTPSEGSRRGRHLADRGRSASIATTTMAEWTGVTGLEAVQQWHQATSNVTQDLRSSPFDPALTQYGNSYTPPRMASPLNPATQLLGVPATFGGLFLEPVGPPAPPIYRKPLAQPFSVASPRLSTGSAELVEPQQLENLNIATILTSSYDVQMAQLECYILKYWERFDPILPIVHPHSFDPMEDHLLTSAMAAIGTQYVDTTEARQKGVELNEYCKRSIDLVGSLVSLNRLV